MLRVPLPFRGVAVLLLAATTAVGQTPETPTELLLEPIAPSSPDFLRQFSADTRHPLLQLMTDGEFVSLDADSSPSSSRLALAPDAKSTKPSTESSPRLTEVFPDDLECLEAPDFLPFACPPPQPPCNCRKCRRQRKHAHGCNYGPGCGNPYLNWPGGYPGCYGSPSYQGCCCRKCRRKHGCGHGGCGYPNYGYGYPWGGAYPRGGDLGGGFGWGNGMMGYDGFMDGCSTPYIAPPPPPPPPPCFCRKCRRKYGHGHHSYGHGGFMDGCFGGGYAPPPPPPSPCRRCQRRHGCSYGYGYAGSGYPGWPAYPVPGANMVDGGYNGFTDPNCFGCSKHHRCHCRLFHRFRSHHTQPYPWYAYPPAMPSMMEGEPCCMDGGFDGDFSSALLADEISN